MLHLSLQPLLFLNLISSHSGTMLDENHVVDVADQAYLTDMNIYFKEDDLWVLATQHVERWSYSDTGLTPEEAEESVLLVCAGLSSTLTISQLITKSDNLIDTVFRAFSIWQSLLNIGFLRQALKQHLITSVSHPFLHQHRGCVVCIQV